MPSDTQTVYPGIIIRMASAADSVMFPTLTKDALAKIAGTPTGLKLLQDIVARLGKAKFGYTVCIMRADMRYDAGPHRGITENMIRAEANLPLQTTYGGM